MAEILSEASEDASFDRGELQEIRIRARVCGNTVGCSWKWKRAYEDLEFAADRLDAMTARAEV